MASPIYRGSYSGLFKHLFDFVRRQSLIDVPVRHRGLRLAAVPAVALA